MAEKKWTPSQHDAIYARGGSLLVSAAAGSGKTAVLVQRVIGLITDSENPVDADSLLIATFSNAAAAEMKFRISQRIGELLEQTPENYNLLRQKMLLSKANISTVHSFCLNLIRSNFQLLNISPDFAIADEKDLALMRADAAQAVIEQFYSSDNGSGFAELVELISGGRDDKRLFDTVFRLYDFIRSHPFYEDWLDNKLNMYKNTVNVAESDWGITIIGYAKQTVEYCYRLLLAAIAIIKQDDKLANAYLNCFSSAVYCLENAAEKLSENNWDDIVDSVNAITFDRLGSYRGESTGLKDRVQDIWNNVKKLAGNLQNKIFCANARQFAEDIADLTPKIETLFNLTKQFGRKLDEIKAERGVADFTDLEQLALKLLVIKTDNGYKKTAAAEKISKQFTYVLVDEYQDTNEVQDMIFSAVSQNEANLFMVGDVKQSIYRFRQAMPEIFIEKKNRFAPYDGKTYPAQITLGSNFRSRGEVTNAINFLFSLIMSQQLGEIDYTDEEKLTAAAVYPEYQNVQTELDIIDLSTGDEQLEDNKDADEPQSDESADKVTTEARYVANKIKSMVNSGFTVTQDGTMRPAGYGDFCILLRSTKGKSEVYLKELENAGINGWTQAENGFLTSREISSVISLLNAVNNPLSDIDLAAAMLSPLIGFTAGQLAEVKTAFPKESLYMAAKGCAENGDEMCGRFCGLLGQLRLYAACTSTEKLIKRTLDSTNAIAVFSAMGSGEQRTANLRLLVQYATGFEKNGYKGLAGFLHFIARIAEQDDDLAPAAVTNEGAGAVRIMSIHRSKGLEFPVVFLCDTAKRFNKQDINAPILLNSRMGFAVKRRDTLLRRQFSTVPLMALRIANDSSSLSEEMRVLYVALTRAREKLIITAALGDPQKSLQKLYTPLNRGGTIPPYAVSKAQSMADWILMCALHHQNAADLRELAGCEIDDIIYDNSELKINIVKPAAIGQTAAAQQKAITAAPDEELLTCLRQNLSFEYKNKRATEIPTKLGVSAVAKGELAEQYRFNARPAFMGEKGLTAAEKGSAMHRFMQFCNYKNAKSSVKTELKRLYDSRYFTKAEYEAIDIKKLQVFFNSMLADRIFNADKLYRELRFVHEVGSEVVGKYLDYDLGENKIAVQGVADCVFVKNGRAVIIDYKTDYVNSLAELAEKYKAQLEIYKSILSQSLKLPIDECIIYSFCLSGFIVL